MGLEPASITATRSPSPPSRLSTPLLELLFLSQWCPQGLSIVLGLGRGDDPNLWDSTGGTGSDVAKHHQRVVGWLMPAQT